MTNQAAIHLTDTQRRDALDYLKNGRHTKDLANVPSIAHMDRSRIMSAFETAGLVYRLRGSGNGIVYLLTDLGHSALEHLRDEVEVPC